jgi:hypothetical protein
MRVGDIDDLVNIAHVARNNVVANLIRHGTV